VSIIDYTGSNNPNALVLTDNSTQLRQDVGSSVQSGVISETGGSFGLEKIGSGTLIFEADNTYTGVTTISDGTLQLGWYGYSGSITGDVIDNALLVFLRRDDITFGGVISGTGGVEQAARGMVILTGANTYTGGTTVDVDATLQIGNGGTTGSLPDMTAAPFWITNNGTLIFNRSDTSILHNIVNGTGEVFKQGAGTLIVTGTLNGTRITVSQGILQFGSGPEDGGFNADVTNNAALTFDYNANFISHIGHVVSGSGSVTLSGGGGVIYDAAQTYTGGTVISAGLLQLGTGGNLSSAGALTINGGTFDLAGRSQVIGTLSGTGGTIALGGGSLTSVSNVRATLASTVTGNGSFTYAGASTAGVLILSGANTYSGGTIVNGGILSLGAGGSLLNSGNLTVNIGGIFDLANQNQTIGALGGSGGEVSLASGTLTTDFAGSSTFVGAITGSGNFIKSGTGTLVVGGMSNYFGTTTINGGTLQIGSGGTDGRLDSSQTIDNGALIFNPINITRVAGAISGTGTLTQVGSGTLILEGNNTYTGNTTVSAGIIQIGNGGWNGFVAGNIAVSNGATLAFYRSNSLTYNGVISGAGHVTQSGSGTTILGATNTYTGITTVSQGTLLVDGSIASSAVTVASGAILGGAGIAGTTSIQSGGRLAPGYGIGTLHVNGNLTLASGALFSEELSPGAVDEVIVSGNASIAGNLTANFSGGSYGHQTYTILHSSGALSGTFANLSVTGLPAGVSVGLTYGAHDVTLTTDSAPATATANISARQGQSIALSNLFSVSDADGDAITGYQLWDSTRDPLSGHFEINGVAQAAGTIINVSAAQLAQTSFVAGSVGDSLQIRAFDGYAWSAADNAGWSPFTLSIRSNSPPSLSTTTQRLTAGQSLALSSLTAVTDADGDTITRYQLWDSTRDPNSGHWMVNGQAQAAGTVIDITAAQLGQTSFVAGTVNDSLQIRAFDGIAWSAPDTGSWAPFTIGPQVNNAPAVQTSNRSIARGVTTALSSLITVSDADSDTITEYQLWDGSRDPNSGHFVVNNVVQAAGTIIDISAAQLGQTTFVTGSLGDSLQIRAFDGISWSAADTASWSPFTVSVPDAAPVVSTSNVTKSHLQNYVLSSLFSATDADGDAMTRYQLWDSTRDPNSGHFVINGQAQSAGTVIDITAAQLAQTSFFTGMVGDNLQIRAFDGIAWSDADTASWAPFTVSIPANNPPVVSTGSQNAMHGRTLALSSLFSVTDADGDAMTRYQLWDSTRDPLSGHFVVNGVAQAAGTVIDITAAQLGQTSFVTGEVSDSLQIRAFDGLSWSDADNASWQPFNISVTPYTSPSMSTQDVSITAGQSLALSGLINITDLDGDSMTRYELWDSTRGPNSGSWVVNGQVQAAGTVIDITAAQLTQTNFLSGTAGIIDSVQVRAFDGINWTAADNAAWAPFHITAT
jgi:autotransporter-associated beta strand protein